MSASPPRVLRWAPLPVVVALAGCGGKFSALRPAGRDAEQIATLFYWMAAGAAVVWAAVMLLALFATRRKTPEPDLRRARLYIIGGGAVFPTVVLTVLLIFGLGMMPQLLDAGPAEGPRIRVVGERWWWRVQYQLGDQRGFELANEIWLPVGARFPIHLETADVIHSLWVPALAGKIDMIPGRVNRMALQPTHAGTFGGECAEYCGISHANMRFSVVAVERAEFDRWLAAQAAPARPPQGAAAERGAELFRVLGCGACHTVRGTGARGTIGPDLTHVGSRATLGAGILPNDTGAFHQWLEDLHRVKPGVLMPPFDMLPEEDRMALAAYLEGLE